MRPRTSTCAPARGVKPTSEFFIRNMAQRSCASRSLREKYQWPEDGCEKFDSSPSTHSTPSPRSRSTRTSRFTRVTLYTSRTGSARTRSSGFTGIKYLSTRFTGDRVRRSEEHTSELQSLRHLVCRLLLEKKKKIVINHL